MSFHDESNYINNSFSMKDVDTYFINQDDKIIIPKNDVSFQRTPQISQLSVAKTIPHRVSCSAIFFVSLTVVITKNDSKSHDTNTKF